MFHSEKPARFWCLTALAVVLVMAVLQVGWAMAEDPAGDAAPAHQRAEACSAGSRTVRARSAR